MNAGSIYFFLVAFLFMLLLSHVVLLRILKAGKLFWIFSDYLYYGLGMVGILFGLHGLYQANERNSLDRDIGMLRSQIDSLVLDLTLFRGGICGVNSEQNERLCFAADMMIRVINVWRIKEAYPLTTLPSCEDHEDFLKRRFHWQDRPFQAGRVSAMTGENAIHSVCIKSSALSSESLESQFSFIEQTLKCNKPYRQCPLSNSFYISSQNIDNLRSAAKKRYDVFTSADKYDIYLRIASALLVAGAISLRITKATHDFRGARGD